MRDLPRGAELLAAARAVLVDELMPLLPAERRFDALLVGNCLAIAAREAAGDELAAASARELRRFYGQCSDGPASCAETRELWRRFARDLRLGAFETAAMRERRARAILWRLTIAKLRLANPKFIQANGLAEPGSVGD